MATKSKKPNLPVILLQAGLVIIFLYAGVSSLKTPSNWVIYLPRFVRDHFSAISLIKLLAIYELALAVWLASGKYLKYAALLSALTLAGIVVFNLSFFDITFRDIGLAFAALALFFSS